MIHTRTFFCHLQALSGFLMMMTQNGKLLYISDNAAEYLGHSMVSEFLFICVKMCPNKKYVTSSKINASNQADTLGLNTKIA